ncbi:MAG TPA: Holliday junction branch migration protein RuvA [Desulfotignum sp.]|nr:Holliday junction branch migration protein RuvA [Desulfotignum sp.]
MIGYLEGHIIHCETDAVLLLAGGVGYEVLVNSFTMTRVTTGTGTDDIVSLYIYYHVSERQPKPVLIGFASLEEKAFFQLFISVAAIGPMKAVRALVRPVGEIARAIEQKDVTFLGQLPGIGKRTAEKIIATLHGKAMMFMDHAAGSACEQGVALAPDKQEIALQVTGVLVEQLGHSAASARRMIQAAFEKHPDIHTPESLLDAIYQEGL